MAWGGRGLGVGEVGDGGCLVGVGNTSVFTSLTAEILSISYL